jgi:hypothetical protein
LNTITRSLSNNFSEILIYNINLAPPNGVITNSNKLVKYSECHRISYTVFLIFWAVMKNQRTYSQCFEVSDNIRYCILYLTRWQGSNSSNLVHLFSETSYISGSAYTLYYEVSCSVRPLARVKDINGIDTFLCYLWTRLNPDRISLLGLGFGYKVKKAPRNTFQVGGLRTNWHEWNV